MSSCEGDSPCMSRVESTRSFSIISNPRGGVLQLAFEQLKCRLEAEGSFDGKDKQPLPAFPRTRRNRDVANRGGGSRSDHRVTPSLSYLEHHHRACTGAGGDRLNRSQPQFRH